MSDPATTLNVIGGQIARFRDEVRRPRTSPEDPETRRLRGRVSLLLDSLAPQVREVELELRGTPAGLAVAERLYLWMLRELRDESALERLRIRSQGELIALRDFIAAATGRPIQEVQDEYEARALAPTVQTPEHFTCWHCRKGRHNLCAGCECPECKPKGERLIHIGDVLVHVGEPPNGNPYAAPSLMGIERAHVLRWFKDRQDVSAYTFWHAPASGGAVRLTDPSRVDWSGLREK